MKLCELIIDYESGELMNIDQANKCGESIFETKLFLQIHPAKIKLANYSYKKNIANYPCKVIS